MATISASCTAIGQAVRVDLAPIRFSRLVIGVPEGGDPETEAVRIAAAAGIAPSAPVS